jgi:hypothetical protein
MREGRKRGARISGGVAFGVHHGPRPTWRIGLPSIVQLIARLFAPGPVRNSPALQRREMCRRDAG